MVYRKFYNVPAEASSLGEPLEEYNVTQGIDIEKLGWGAAIFAVIVGIQLCRFATLGPGWLLSIVVLIGLFVAIVWFIQYRRRDWRIITFEDGFSHTLRGKTDIIVWDDIKYIWQSITNISAYGVAHISTAHTYTVELKNGRKYVFMHAIQNIERMGEKFQKETFKRAYPKAMEALHNGEAVSFGKISISQNGLHRGKATLLWQEFKGISINQGTISIKKDGKWLSWASVKVQDMPNFFVFMAIVGQIMDIEA